MQIVLQKIGFDISDNLHEMSNPDIFSGKTKKNINLSSAEFTQGMVIVMITFPVLQSSTVWQ